MYYNKSVNFENGLRYDLKVLMASQQERVFKTVVEKTKIIEKIKRVEREKRDNERG